jgi:hypothetical protein
MTGSWIVRAIVDRGDHLEALDALADAGLSVEISARRAYNRSWDEVVLVVWVRDTRLTSDQFLQRARTALGGIAFEIETPLLCE